PRRERPPPAQLTDHPPADRLDASGKVGVGRGLTLEKAWEAPLVGAIAIDPFQAEQGRGHMELERPATAREKGHRPWMGRGPRAPACPCLVEIILTTGGAEDGLDCGGAVR